MDVDVPTTKTTTKAAILDEEGIRTKTQLPWVEKYRPERYVPGVMGLESPMVHVLLLSMVLSSSGALIWLFVCCLLFVSLSFTPHTPTLYRLEDLVAHDDIIRIITNLIDSDNLPHLLLYGPPGSGKTSTIVAAAKRMYGKSYGSMTLELNASDARGIDVVRNEIKEFAGTQQLFHRGIKLIILDEADAMTQDAQNALRRIIEKYTKNARFCMICNYVSKIIPALQSRCTRFRFAPLLPSQIEGRLEHVIQSENIEITKEGKAAIMRLSGGDMRRVLNLLQSTAMSHNRIEPPRTVEATTTSGSRSSDDTIMQLSTEEPITENDVYLTSGAPLPMDVGQILEWMMTQSFAVAYENVVTLCSTKGYALVDVLQDMTTLLLAQDDMDNVALGKLLNGMSNVENRLAAGTDEKIQAASLVGVFVETREAMKSQ